MSVGQAIRISRHARGIQRNDLTGVGYTESMLGKVERGERRLAKDVAPALASRIDHPALYIEIAREFTGGVGPAYLNGENVDNHRSAVREKCLEEMFEAQEWIRKQPTSKPPSAETEGERKKRREHLLQVLDVIQGCTQYVAVQCEDYGFSMRGLYQDHYRKLMGLRYLQS